jgi:signal transduction histidine kinase
MTELFNRLSFRLAVLYAVIFTVSTAIVLLILYNRVASIAQGRVDDELVEETDDFEKLLAASGVAELKRQMQLEAAAEDEYPIFYRLFSEDGNLLASAAGSENNPLPIDRSGSKQPDGKGNAAFETLSPAGGTYKIRTIHRKIGPGLILQVGLSLEESQTYLVVFRRLLYLILIPVMLLAALAGGFMSNQALAGIEEIAKAADDIAHGNSRKRVQVTHRSLEIDRLSASFNAMLDHLHVLLQQMREMTDNIAHDLRSPLARIRGYAEMALIGANSKDDLEQAAGNTVEECDNLINLINTMLEIAELESGITPVKTQQIDLNRLIQEAGALFSQIAKDKNIHLDMELQKTAVLMGDKGKIQRMVTNLLENAIKYTPAGGSVTISAAITKTTAEIRVSDTGIGIAPTDIPRIFQRFYRCDASRSEPGLGLGLSLAKALAECVGGTLTVDSRVNAGSTFALALPAAATD